VLLVPVNRFLGIDATVGDMVNFLNQHEGLQLMLKNGLPQRWADR
jgi:hypothetical protein